MLIIDAHQDIAYNALEWGRNIRLPVETTRRREAHRAQLGEKTPGLIAMSGLPELRRGGFGVVFGTIFAEPARSTLGASGNQSQHYHNAEEAYRVGQQQLEFYRELAEEPGICLISDKDDLNDILVAWEGTAVDDKERPLGIVLLMEGADPIRHPEEAVQWYEDGVRIVGLAWQQTRFSGGTFAPGPLTAEGRALLREMHRIGLALDVSHLAEESFWQALERFNGPVIASHSNCRSFVHTDRHLSDDMIRALIERDGVIGMVAVNSFLHGDWRRNNRFPVGLDQMVRHIDHICQLAGDARHVGIGTDIDGGFGREETPTELENVSDVIKLADALRDKGYKEEDVTNIMNGNWQRFLERILPEA